MFSLNNKLIVITGAAGIIGRNMVRALTTQGARVIAIDLDLSKITELAEEIKRDNTDAEIYPVAVDITNREALVKEAELIKEIHGDVNVLVNNAAAKSKNFFEPFETFPEEDWDFVMGVNLKGAVFACQIFGAEMAQRNSGSIINTLSIYGIVAPDQRIYNGAIYEGKNINSPAVYSASKAGLWGLTKYLASYWGEKGVRVNAITPGGVYSGQNDEFVSNYSARIPMSRMAESHELNGALVYLASDESSYVTGQNIAVDGGLTAW